MKTKNKSRRSASSQRWLDEHFRDTFVKQAQREGYRSRAVYKLMEIQKKDNFIKPGMNVVDLGAAPGGWSQYLVELLGTKGQVFALDILPMPPIKGVQFLQGDFSKLEVVEQLETIVPGAKVDVVLSDIAPNLSGMKAVDQPRFLHLAEMALEFACYALKPGGFFLVKMFHGEGSDEYLKQLRTLFDSVVIRKPEASRARSPEVYFLSKGFQGFAKLANTGL